MASRKPPGLGVNNKSDLNHGFPKSPDLIPSLSPFNGPNSVYDRNGGIIVRTVVHLDPDSDLFMKVAQRAYQDHERSLVPCLKCGRKFFPDRIEMHERNCAATKLPDPKIPDGRNMNAKPAISSIGVQNSAKTVRGESLSTNPRRNPKHTDISGRQRWK